MLKKMRKIGSMYLPKTCTGILWRLLSSGVPIPLKASFYEHEHWPNWYDQVDSPLLPSDGNKWNFDLLHAALRCFCLSLVVCVLFFSLSFSCDWQLFSWLSLLFNIIDYSEGLSASPLLQTSQLHLSGWQNFAQVLFVWKIGERRSLGSF